jgi:putative transposase
MDAIKNIRLKKYDYKSDGYYFVTAVCDGRQNYFIAKEKTVEKELMDLKHLAKGLEIDYFVVMPNHVHLIFVLHQCNLALGEIVRKLKAKVSHSFGQKIWQPNYYEHVIRNDRALDKIREYIQNNPKELLMKFDQFYM